MTNAEAVTRLSMIFANCDTETCKGTYVCKYCDEAVSMAIEALKQQSPCDMCENEKKDCWEMCQFCPAEPKGSDEQ